MPKAIVIVEGPTEATFISAVLNPFFRLKSDGAWIQPIIVETKRAASGEKFKGGTVPYPRFRSDVRRALGDKSTIVVTTLVDLFELHDSFPGHTQASSLTFRDRVRVLEDAMGADVNDPRFIPYLSTHEFEALLLCDPSAVVSASGGAKKDLVQLQSSLREFASPEEINGAQSPSNRIRAVMPHYNKVIHGATAAMNIGVAAMAKSCLHFGEWLGKLEEVLL